MTEPMTVTHVTLTPSEYRLLKNRARRRKRTVEALIREAVEMTYLRPKPPAPAAFRRLAAFGMWRGDPRTDEEVLNELGGDWRDFPLTG